MDSTEEWEEGWVLCEIGVSGQPDQHFVHQLSACPPRLDRYPRRVDIPRELARLIRDSSSLRGLLDQAVALHGHARTRGLKTWVHTCGFMAKLTEMGAYESMDLDVVESLSPPPLGDLTDLKAGRARIGAAITTRGAVGVDQFYAADLGAVRERVRYVLESTRGYRHMVGDTNDSYPPYPRENILAVVDEVRKSGRLLPADQAD